MSTIDELIKLADGDSKLLGAIQELQQYRESALRPAGKFLNNDFVSQYKHVESEQREVRQEFYNYMDCCYMKENPFKERFLDELNDNQISIETLKAIIEPDENKRRESMIKTIQKNAARNYYDK